MEVQGRIVRVLGETSGTNQQGNPWRKFEYLFGYYENPSDIYERHVVLSFMNDRVDQYKNFKENDKVKVRIALTAYERPQGSGKFYNDIRTGDMSLIVPVQQPAPQPQADGGTGAAPTPVGQQSSAVPGGGAFGLQNQPPVNQEGGENGDDLPF